MSVLTENVVLTRSRAKSLSSVKKLNCWGTGISDVSILQKMPNVEVVTLSVNDISSLKDFAYCSKLKELYVRRNSVASLEEIQFLKNLPCLKVLWLADNPCTEEENYRSTVLKNLPQIEKLDNIEVSLDEVEEATNAGEEYLVPDEMPVYNDENRDEGSSNEDRENFRLPENGHIGTEEFANNETTSSELLDQTNKLRTQLGLKPLLIEEPTMDDDNDVPAKSPLPSSTENGLGTSTKSSNVLSAVLLLLDDLEEDDLRIVQNEIVRKLEINEGSPEPEEEKQVDVLM